MKFFDLEMDGYLAKHVIVFNHPQGNSCMWIGSSDCTSFIKGPLDETCQSDGTIWRKGQGHCKPDDM